MNKYDREILGERISIFFVDKSTSNEVVLEMIYKDLSIKLDFIKSIYPFFKGGLVMYDIMFKHYGIKIKPILKNGDSLERFKDTFEECEKAFENGMFNVERSYFGRGEWPIILFDRVSQIDKDKDWITYTITR